MPFCPKCRTQYREGFTLCSDCKIPLVDELTDDYEIEGLEGLNNPAAATETKEEANTGVGYTIFADINSEPNIELIDAGRKIAMECHAERIR